MYSDLFVKCNNLVALVMQNQAEKVIDLLESGNVDTKILNDIGCCSSPLPLIIKKCVLILRIGIWMDYWMVIWMI